MARAATTSDAFNAIAEPQRREILVLLRVGERPVTGLARDLGMTQPQASKHLRVLRDAGLVRASVDGQRRIYAIEPAPFAELDTWLVPYRRLWNERLDALGRHLDTRPQREET